MKTTFTKIACVSFSIAIFFIACKKESTESTAAPTPINYCADNTLEINGKLYDLSLSKNDTSSGNFIVEATHTMKILDSNNNTISYYSGFVNMNFRNQKTNPQPGNYEIGYNLYIDIQWPENLSGSVTTYGSNIRSGTLNIVAENGRKKYRIVDAKLIKMTSINPYKSDTLHCSFTVVVP